MLSSIVTVAAITGVISGIVYEEITEVNTETNPNNPTQIEEEITTTNTAFNKSLLVGLGGAIVISTGIALIVSLSLSQHMTSPIQAMITVTKSIAEGNYNHRIAYHNQDEIGELAGHLNHMAEALDTIEVSRRQLLTDLTHELNTPLTSIVGSIEGLQDGTITSTETTYSVILDEALRLQRLVHDVQYLSVMEANTYSFREEPLCVCDLLQSVSAKLDIQYESKAVKLDINYPPRSLLVWGDPDRIVQVLINLLGNALQYSSSGGQVITSIYDKGSFVEFIITDTGIGITASDLTQIFDRFYRIEKSRNRGSGGSGIGLTIAHQIIKAHGGQIWAESQGLGMGSQFHFTLRRTL
jgi:histidine kinase